MPLTGIYGKGGSGKTLIAIYFLAKFFPKIQKYLNFDVKLPKCEKIDSIKLFELPETEDLIIVVWDEAYTEIEDRNFMSMENRINSYLLFQARKNNMSIISISQLNILDFRWRRLEERVIFCHDRPILDKNFNHFKGDFHYSYSNGKRIFPFTLKYKDAKKLFPLYATKQKIFPKGFELLKEKIRLKDPKERNKMINHISKIVIKKYGLPDKKKDLTHNWLKDKMLDLELELTFEPYVYIRLHSKKQ